MKAKSIILTVFLLFCVVFNKLEAQITFNVPGYHNDVLSKTAYTKMVKQHAEIAVQTSLQRAATMRLHQLHADYNKELTRIGADLLNSKPVLQKFATVTCMDFIKKKYPIVNLAAADFSFIKNTVKRNRLQQKLQYEAERIGDYLDASNPISEGKRLFLILSSLEKAIEITMEKEEF